MVLAEWVRELSALHFWLLLAGAGAATGVAFFLWFRWLLRLRLIADTPTAVIRSAPQGYVELTGQARLMPGEPIQSPLSGRRCVWYRYSVERRSEGGRDWSLVENATSDAIFLIDDGTGACIVDPEGARVIASLQRRWYGQQRRPGVEPVDRGWIARLFPTGPYRYRETLIREDEPLYAIGQLVALGSADPALPQAEIRDLLRAWKRDPAALKRRFDRDGDRQISPEEWEWARQEAEREVMTSWHEKTDGVDYPLLRKPRDGRPFVLSTVPETVLLRRLHTRALLAAVAFLGCGAVVAQLVKLRFAG